MAITASSPRTVKAGVLDGVFELDCDKVNEDVVAFVYRHSENGDAESAIRLANLHTNTFGSEVSIDGFDILNPSIAYLQDEKLALFYEDNDSAEDEEVYGAVVNVSGLTPTIGSPTEIATDFDGRMCPVMGSASLGLLAYRNNDGGLQQYWQRFDVAGNSIVVSGSPLDNDDNVDIIPFRRSLCALGPSRYVQVYAQDTTGDLTAVVLNAQVGLTKGTESIYTPSAFVFDEAVAKIDSTHCLILYKEDNFSTTRSIKAVVITIAGDTITFGTPVTLETGASLASTSPTIDIIRRSDTKFVVAYNLSSSASTVKVETLTVNGTTITQDGDGGTFTGFNVEIRLIGYPGTEGIVYYQDGANAVYRVLSNLPEEETEVSAIFYWGNNNLVNSRSIRANG